MTKTIFTTLTATFFSLALFAQNVDQIVAKHIEAIGGKDNWLKVKSMRSEGTVKANGMDIKITNTQIHNKATRTDIALMGMNGYTLITTTEGWIFLPFQGQTKPEPMTADDVKSGQQELNIHDDLMSYKELGKKLEDLGLEDMDGTECYKLKLIDEANNSETTYYLDPTSYLIIKETTKATANGQEMENSTSYSNYQKTPEGVLIAMNVIGGFGDFEVTKIEINPTIDESIFTVKQ